MYEDFYNLEEKPFDLLPNPHFLYMSSGHDNAYTHLEYAVYENKGFVVISGEVGCGKTTLINYLLRKIPTDLHVGLISHTDVDPELFFKLICRRFELEHDGLDKGEMIILFQDFLLRSRQKQIRVALIIDEAQNLPDRTLEEIRMLSNLEAEKEHLVQIILVGQPELRQKLRRPHLRQFLQRITVHYHLEGLKDQDELREYIRHRLHVAGCPTYATLFTDQAISAVWAESQGIPRLINYICDMALVHGYADGLTIIDEKTINEVIEARSESSLFGGEEPDLKEYEDQVAQNSSENSHVQNEALETLGSRVSFLESMVEAQATQLQELSSDRTTRDQLTLEIFHLLQKDIEKRWALNNRYQLLLAELKQLKRSQEFNGQMMVAPGEPETEVEIQKKKSLFKKIFS